MKFGLRYRPLADFRARPFQARTAAAIRPSGRPGSQGGMGCPSAEIPKTLVQRRQVQQSGTIHQVLHRFPGNGWCLPRALPCRHPPRKPAIGDTTIQRKLYHSAGKGPLTHRPCPPVPVRAREHARAKSVRLGWLGVPLGRWALGAWARGVESSTPSTALDSLGFAQVCKKEADTSVLRACILMACDTHTGMRLCVCVTGNPPNIMGRLRASARLTRPMSELPPFTSVVRLRSLMQVSVGNLQGTGLHLRSC